MDPNHVISSRLFRDHCVKSDGVFVKDLGLLGRDLSSIVIIDNAAQSFKFQPRNGIECAPFIDDASDTELSDMVPFLEYLAIFVESRSCVGCAFVYQDVERVARGGVPLMHPFLSLYCVHTFTVSFTDCLCSSILPLSVLFLFMIGES